jgi:hypothetical protein
VSQAEASAVARGSEPIVVYQSADREGSTFGLSSDAQRFLRAHFGSAVHLAPRVFVAHETRADYDRLHGSLSRQILMLLTGLSEERLAEVGPIEFRDPVTEQRLG